MQKNLAKKFKKQGFVNLIGGKRILFARLRQCGEFNC